MSSLIRMQNLVKKVGIWGLIVIEIAEEVGI